MDTLVMTNEKKTEKLRGTPLRKLIKLQEQGLRKVLRQQRGNK